MVYMMASAQVGSLMQGKKEQSLSSGGKRKTTVVLRFGSQLMLLSSKSRIFSLQS